MKLAPKAAAVVAASTALMILTIAPCAGGRFSTVGFGMVVLGDLVTDVHTTGMAARAGIRPGDVIVRFDGSPLGTPKGERSLLVPEEPSKGFAIEVMRNGKPVTLTIRVVRVPKDQSERVPIGKEIPVELVRNGKPLTLTINVIRGKPRPGDQAERMLQEAWLKDVILREEMRRNKEAEDAKRQAAAKAQAEAAQEQAQAASQRKEALRRECGDDYQKIRVGMTLDRLEKCWGKFHLFRRSGQVNRADGVVSIYETQAPYEIRVHVIGVSTIYVMEGKVVAWTR